MSGFLFLEDVRHDCLTLLDDLIISICCKLSSTATKPSDFFNILISCVIFQPRSYIFLLQRILILVFLK